MKKRIYVIADSFGNHLKWIKPRKNEDVHFWVEDLQNKLSDHEIIVNAQGSRDIQTIIDTWIRTLKFLKEDDLVIVCLPYFRRTRLPYDEKSYIVSESENYQMVTRFVGTPSYDNRHEFLERWGKDNDWKFYQEKLEYQEYINTTKAYQLNIMEIVDSLVEITKNKTYIFSWDDMDIKSKHIEDKPILEKNIGLWETHHDIFYETDGEFGMLGDLHWSHKMQEKFANYIFEKFFI